MSSTKTLCVAQRVDSHEKLFWWWCHYVLIRLLLFGLALGHFPYILPETQFNMKNMSLQSSAHAGKVTVGDAMYPELSKESGVRTIYRSWTNNEVNVSKYTISRNDYWVNTPLTDIKWLNGIYIDIL